MSIAAAEHDTATGTVETPEQTNHETAERETALSASNIEARLRGLLTGETGELHPEKPGDEPQPGNNGEATTIEDPDKDKGGDPGEDEDTQTQRAQWPESAQKRVDKLTAQKGELKTQVESLTTERDQHQQRVTELEQQLAEAGTAPAPSNEPLGFITNQKQLSDYAGAVRGHVRQIEDYLDGALEGERLEQFTAWAKGQGAVDESGEVNQAKLKQLRRLGQDTLTDYVPQRLNFFNAEAQHSAMAEKRWPWLKDPKSTEFKSFEGVTKALPEIKRLPHWKAIGAIYVRGLMAVEAEQAEAAKKGNGKPTPAARPGAKAPRMPGPATAVPQRQTESKTNIQALREKANRTGNPKDFEALTRAFLEEAPA